MSRLRGVFPIFLATGFGIINGGIQQTYPALIAVLKINQVYGLLVQLSENSSRRNMGKPGQLLSTMVPFHF